MKTTEYIFGMVVAAVLILIGQACSDNLDPDYKPTAQPAFLKVDGHEATFTRSLKADSPDLTMQVESNTLWRIEVENDGGWLKVDKTDGRGNEPFIVSVARNMNEARNGSITVYTVDAQGNRVTGPQGKSIQVNISQESFSVSLSPLSIKPFAAENSDPQKFEIKSNVEWKLDVSYEVGDAERFVTIMPETETMKESGDGSFSGIGDASFSIKVSDNRTVVDRRANLNLHSEFGTTSVEIVQNKAGYSFEVRPLDGLAVAAVGGEIKFRVRSLSGWSVKSDEAWTAFSVNSVSEGSSDFVETVATVKPNNTGTERSAKISFVPYDPSLQGVDVEVTQERFDAKFEIRRIDAEGGVVKESGADLQFVLESSFDWRIDNKFASWLRTEPSSGTASSGSQSITVKVDPNYTNEQRDCKLSVIPIPTEFAEDVTLGPEIFKIRTLELSISQSGGKEAAISQPWLIDGYGESEATLRYEFSSQTYPISKAGLEWRKESDTDGDCSKATVTPSDDKAATVEFRLTGLDPGTKYVARGFVIYTNGNVKYGSQTLTFNTTGTPPSSGQTPGIDDNPAP